MEIQLFGGTIFPNQSVINDKELWSYLIDWFKGKIINCNNCSTEWLSIFFVIIFLAILIYFIFKNNK